MRASSKPRTQHCKINCRNCNTKTRVIFRLDKNVPVSNHVSACIPVHKDGAISSLALHWRWHTCLWLLAAAPLITSALLKYVRVSRNASGRNPAHDLNFKLRISLKLPRKRLSGCNPARNLGMLEIRTYFQTYLWLQYDGWSWLQALLLSYFELALAKMRLAEIPSII